MSTKSLIFQIDGHEISATFADARNDAVQNHIKQILLSAFVGGVSKSCSGDILVSLRPQRYNKGSDSCYAP